MLELDIFYEEMAKLATIFSPLSDKEMEIYRDHLLGIVSEGTFARAVNWLIENHTYKRFPMIAEIRDAIDEVGRRDQEQKHKDGELPAPTCRCRFCNDTGWEIESNPKGYDLAHYCECERGRRMLSDHRIIWKKTGWAWREPKPWKKPKEEGEETGPAIEEATDVPRPSGSLATPTQNGPATESADDDEEDADFV